MRLSFQHLAAALAATLAGTVVAGCQGSDLPMPPNGPDSQFFSTNNALLRVVNGSPTAGSPCTVAGQATHCVDVAIDGSIVARGVPYPTIPALDAFAILPYVSVPSGQALIQIYQSPTTPGGPEGSLVYGLPATISANKKYSFVLAGQAPLPPPAPPFFQGYLFNDGLFNAVFGATMADFHNASLNAGGVQFQVTCASCTAGGEPIGKSNQGAGAIVGPVSLIPSSGYTLGTAAQSVSVAAINALDTGGVLPDPFGKQNVSVYLVDTVGGAGSYQAIAVEDTNG